MDKNPLAVEMAKLSLWLLTLAKDKPFTFLDHAIRCGDSLVGVSSETQLKTFSLDGQGIGITLPNFLDMIPKIMDATRLLRIRLEKIADDTVGNIEEKQRLFDNIRFQTKRLNYAADRLLAASWQPAKPAERVALLRKALQEVDDRIRDVDPDTLEAEGRASREEVGCPRAVPLAAGVSRGFPRPGRVRCVRRQSAVHGRERELPQFSAYELSGTSQVGLPR